MNPKSTAQTVAKPKATTMTMTECNQTRGKLATMSAKDRAAALARMNESQRAIVTMDAKAATTTKAKTAKSAAKPGESLTASIYKKRREEAANARTAPAPVHPIFSKEYAAQVYSKRNHGAHADPHND